MTFSGLLRDHLPVDEGWLEAWCQRWQVTELAFFGSVFRADFRSDSDVDVLVRFSATSEWSLLDHIAMEEELTTFFGRPVDLVSRRAVEASRNEIRRHHILDSAQVVYAA
jgi:predicted nucleotidyltransferase